MCRTVFLRFYKCYRKTRVGTRTDPVEFEYVFSSVKKTWISISSTNTPASHLNKDFKEKKLLVF